MLCSLTIRDFVIVERLELDLGSGFTVFTGETGAGKSILIDALALVLGARADALAVRDGAARAEIAAEFDSARVPALTRWLDEHELGADQGICLMRRVIETGGRSRAYINGRPATLVQLREAGEFLVDIHGQHEHQSLARAGVQRELLDGFGGLVEQAAHVATLFRAWEAAREERAALEANAAALESERAALSWQLQELEALEFTVEGWQSLQAEHARLVHAASLIEGAQYGLQFLAEGESPALTQLNGVIARLKSLAGYDPSLAEILGVLEPAAIQVQEAVYSLRHYQQRLDLDPQRLQEAERRLDAVHSACRKYRTGPEALPQLVEHARGRRAQLEAGGDLQALQRREDETHAAWLLEARKLSAARREAAARLSTEVTAAMQSLAMAGGAFEVALEPAPAPAAHGLEQVEFRVAPHSGARALPLAKVASGGELSRLSLALQTVTSQVAQVPTLVFDEVDVGIGGRVAEIVGRLLKALGRTHQVMCITHLPQVAAAADHQWQVTKTSVKGTVTSEVTRLAPAARVEEIARMLGGVRITDTTRRHAAELLDMKPERSRAKTPVPSASGEGGGG